MWPPQNAGGQELLRNWKATGDGYWPTLKEDGELEPDVAREIAYIFTGAIQENNRPSNFRENEWVEGTFDGTHFWERAVKLDGTRFARDARKILGGEQRVVDAPSLSKVKRIQAAVRRSGRYVALVNGDRQFENLVDRYELLDRSAPELAELIGD